MKSSADVAHFVPTVTVIFPVVAPEGTVTMICTEVADEIVAALPLNFTISAEIVELKFLPVMVTIVPAAPVTGEKPVTDGESDVVSGSEPVLLSLVQPAIEAEIARITIIKIFFIVMLFC